MTFESYSNDVEVMKGRLLGWLDELFIDLRPVEAEASEEHGWVRLKIPAGRLTIHVCVLCDPKDGKWAMLGGLTDKEGRGRDCADTGEISQLGLARVLLDAYQKALECGVEEKR